MIYYINTDYYFTMRESRGLEVLVYKTKQAYEFWIPNFKQNFKVNEFSNRQVTEICRNFEKNNITKF